MTITPRQSAASSREQLGEGAETRGRAGDEVGLVLGGLAAEDRRRRRGRARATASAAISGTASQVSTSAASASAWKRTPHALLARNAWTGVWADHASRSAPSGRSKASPCQWRTGVSGARPPTTGSPGSRIRTVPKPISGAGPGLTSAPERARRSAARRGRRRGSACPPRSPSPATPARRQAPDGRPCPPLPSARP